MTQMSKNENGSEQQELIVLVHGFCSKRLWMRALERRLDRMGFQTCSWGYNSLAGRLPQHAARLSRALQQLAADGRRINIVAHSMGAIIARQALAEASLPSLGRIVLLAPPNRGSRVARFWSPVLRPLFPAVAQLSSHRKSFVNQLPECNVAPVGIISARFDMLVSRRHTRLEGQSDHVCLLATHNSLLFQRATARQIEAFLKSGRFQITGRRAA